MSKKQVYGAIDIGSNAVRAFVGKISSKKKNPEVKKIAKKRIPLRIGSEVLLTNKISESTKSALIDALDYFNSLFVKHEVTDYKVCATEALRIAENGPDIVAEIESVTGIKVHMISGETEAQIVFSHKAMELASSGKHLLFADVGGGSADFVYNPPGQDSSAKSFNLGTLRLLTGTVPDGEWENLKTFLSEISNLRSEIQFFGSGGNIRAVRKIFKKKASQPLLQTELLALLNEMEALSVKERMAKWNLRSDRADVIVPALKIFTFILENTGLSEVFVPQTSLCKGLILQEGINHYNGF